MRYSFILKISIASMKWMKLQQQENYLDWAELGCTPYDGHLLTYRNGQRFNHGSKFNVFCCWNIETNCWKTFEVQSNIKRNEPKAGNLLVFDELLLTCKGNSERLILSFFNLDTFALPYVLPPEEKRLRTLFMNQQESDIAFSIQGKIIPAHKQILTQKSRYFANPFNSGMIESRQDIIDIQDCDFLVFQEFLRYIYVEEFKLDIDDALKLLTLADKYLQDDLYEKLMNSVKYHLSFKNIYKILDFACEKNILDLKKSCLKWLQIKLKIDNTSELIKYLDDQKRKPEPDQDILKLYDEVLDFVIVRYVQISQNYQDHIQFYEDFLIKNLQVDIILKIIKLIFQNNPTQPIINKSLGGRLTQGQINKETSAFESKAMTLRNAVFTFVEKNFEAIKSKKIDLEFPTAFYSEFVSYLMARSDQNKTFAQNTNREQERADV